MFTSTTPAESPLSQDQGLGRWRCWASGAVFWCGDAERKTCGATIRQKACGATTRQKACGATTRIGEACGGCAPRISRARGGHDYVTGDLRVKLAAPEGNQVMLAARHGWLSAAKRGEARRG